MGLPLPARYNAGACCLALLYLYLLYLRLAWDICWYLCRVAFMEHIFFLCGRCLLRALSVASQRHAAEDMRRAARRPLMRLALRSWRVGLSWILPLLNIWTARFGGTARLQKTAARRAHRGTGDLDATGMRRCRGLPSAADDGAWRLARWHSPARRQTPLGAGHRWSTGGWRSRQLVKAGDARRRVSRLRAGVSGNGRRVLGGGL